MNKRSTSSKAKLASQDHDEKTEQIAEHPPVQASLVKIKTPSSMKDVDGADIRQPGGQTGDVGSRTAKLDDGAGIRAVTRRCDEQRTAGDWRSEQKRQHEERQGI